MRKLARGLALLAGLPLGCGRGVSFPPGQGEWSAPPALSFAGGKRLATADLSDDTLAFVSLDLPAPKLHGLEPVGDIPIEIEGPHDLKGSPDGEFIYVVMSNYAPGTGSGPHGAHGLGTVPGSLLKLRARDLVKVGEAQLDKNAAEVSLTADGKTAYVSHYDLIALQRQQAMGLPESASYSTVAVVDTATMARPAFITVCATPHDLALSDDEKTLYVTCSNSDQLAIVDLATQSVKRVFVGPGPGPLAMPSYFPYSALVSPLDGTVWIGCQKTGDLRVYDPKTGKMDDSRRVFVNGVPMFGDFLDGGKTLVMPHQGDDKLSFIDTQTSKEVALQALPASACLNARNLVILDDGRTGYLTCEGDRVAGPGSVLSLDLRARTTLGSVKVGIWPNAMELLEAAPTQ